MSERNAVVWFAAVALCTLGCGELLGSDDLQFERECSGQQDCRDFPGDDPRICHERRCVRLLNDDPATPEREGECQLVLGTENLRRSYPPVVFGALGDLYAAGELGPVTANYELAVREFTSQTAPLVRGATHLPVVVVCGGLADDETMDESFEHLTGNLGIAGVLTPLQPDVLKRSFERLRHQAHREVFFLSPFGSDSQLQEVDDDGLLWHMLGAPAGVGPVYVPLIRRIEDHVSPRDADGERLPMRLALITSERPKDIEIATYVDAHLVLNGRSAGENDDHYRRFETTGTNQASFAAVREGLLEFRPHIIVVLTGEPIVTDVLSPLEGAWSRIAPEQPRPFYVFADQQVVSAALSVAIGTLPTGMRTRVVGVSPAGARDTTLYDGYLRRLTAANSDSWRFENQENYYDAAYFLLYAASAAPGVGKLRGRDLADGMARLLSGPRYDVGTPDMSAALAWLNQDPDHSLSLYGTLGPPDFDPETGVRRHIEGSVWCVSEEPSGELRYRFNVLRLDSSGRELEGNFDCFPGF